MKINIEIIDELNSEYNFKICVELMGYWIMHIKSIEHKETSVKIDEAKLLSVVAKIKEMLDIRTNKDAWDRALKDFEKGIWYYDE